MKKLLTSALLLSLLVFQPLVAQDSQPAQDSKPAPVTGYQALAKQKLIFDTRASKDGVSFAAQEHVTIKKVNSTGTVNIHVELFRVKKKIESLTSSLVEWQPIPDEHFSRIFDMVPPPKREVFKLGDLSFPCVVVSVKNQTFWFVIDKNDNHVFPGVVRIVFNRGAKNEVTALKLSKIEQPKTD